MSCLQNLFTHNLSHPIAKYYEHLKELIDIQENLQFKLLPKIAKNNITFNTFNRMRVNKAKHILGRDVSSAMHFYAVEKDKQEFNTTAVFIEVCPKWFIIITARTPKVALDKTIGNKKRKNNSKIILRFSSLLSNYLEI